MKPPAFSFSLSWWVARVASVSVAFLAACGEQQQGSNGSGDASDGSASDVLAEDAGDLADGQEDAETELGDDAPDAEPYRNACGGQYELSLGSYYRPDLGDPCGCDGRIACNGIEELKCVGEQPRNACGSCGVFDGVLGQPCGTCNDGVWGCDEDVPVCKGTIAPHACGGCDHTLPRPGLACASGEQAGRYVCGELGETTCDVTFSLNLCGGRGALTLDGMRVEPGQDCQTLCGPGLVRCDGNGGATCDGPPPNECGGCSPLAARVTARCGCFGRYECNETGEAVVCSAPSPNACGGCDELEPGNLKPGELCDDGGVRICESNIHTICVPDPASRNRCGGTTELDVGPTIEPWPGGRCDASEWSAWLCDGTENLVCDSDQPRDACGGFSTVAGSPGDACGVCGTGIVLCGDAGKAICYEDLGELALNECGGCREFPGSDERLGRQCGECSEWQCAGGNIECLPDPDDSRCGLQNSCADFNCEGMFRACESIGWNVYGCTACLPGFVEIDGQCVQESCSSEEPCKSRPGPWSACEADNFCAEEGTRSRQAQTYDCLARSCVPGEIVVESEACERRTAWLQCGDSRSCLHGRCSARAALSSQFVGGIDHDSAILVAELTFSGDEDLETRVGFCVRRGTDETSCGDGNTAPCGPGWTDFGSQRLDTARVAYEVQRLVPSAEYQYCAYLELEGLIRRAGLGTFRAGTQCGDRVIVGEEECESDPSLCESGVCGSDCRCVGEESAPDGFAYLPRTNFRMGSPAGEIGDRAADEAVHSVTLSRGFYLMKTEVTEADWSLATLWGAWSQMPKTEVNWVSALMFANTRSDGEGLQRCYSFEPEECTGHWEFGSAGTEADPPCEAVEFHEDCDGYRLPTEAEWEFAARAGVASSVYWNEGLRAASGGELEIPFGFDPQYHLSPVAWYGYNAETEDCVDDLSPLGGPACAGPQPVGQLEPNASGLHDMLGNVWEWTWDGYNGGPLDSGVDPLGSDANERVVRGCGWRSPAGECRLANRRAIPAETVSTDVGFRLARTVSAAALPTVQLEPVVDDRHPTRFLGKLIAPGTGELESLEFCYAEGRTECPVFESSCAGLRGWNRLAGPELYFNDPQEFSASADLVVGQSYTVCALAISSAGVDWDGPVHFAPSEREQCHNSVVDDGEECERAVDFLCLSGICASDCTCVPPDAIPPGFVYVRPGIAELGSPSDEVWRGPGEDLRYSYIEYGFLMQETEAVAEDFGPGRRGEGRFWPLAGVDLFEAANYANRASVQAGLERCYTFEPEYCLNSDEGCESLIFAGVQCTGYRLPTEGEWEYAAKGSLSRTRPELSSVAWYLGNSEVASEPCVDLSPAGASCAGPHEVATRLPNRFGLYDMLGNVLEWTAPSYHPTFQPDVQPQEAITIESPVIRGCAWDSPSVDCREARRILVQPDEASPNLGFRLVRTVVF